MKRAKTLPSKNPNSKVAPLQRKSTLNSKSSFAGKNRSEKRKRTTTNSIKSRMVHDNLLNESRGQEGEVNQEPEVINYDDLEKEIDVVELAKTFNFREDEDEQSNQSGANLDAGWVESPGKKRQSKLDQADQRGEGHGDQDEHNKSIWDKMTNVPASLRGMAHRFAIKSYSTDNIDDSRVEPDDKLDTKYRHDPRYAPIKWMIFPDDTMKYVWDVLLVINLFYTAIIVPYTVSFLDDDIWALDMLEYMSTLIWVVDIFVNFFCAYEDKHDVLIISRKQIAVNYLLGWFVIDLVSVIPFDLFLDNGNLSSFLRLAKLPKLVRFVRLAKFARMMKYLGTGNKVTKAISNWLRLRPGIDRFFLIFALFFIFCHFVCCLWYLQASLNSDDPTNWITRNDLDDEDNFKCYITSFYFIIATVLTVGYGDIHAGNTLERLFAIAFMFLGAVFYSFIIGSLSSVILSSDSRTRLLEAKVNTLMQIKIQHSLDNATFSKVKRALKYGYSRNDQDNLHFLNELPLDLRTKLSVIMHKDMLKSIQFFQQRSEKFLAMIGPMLKSIKIPRNQYIFTEGEHANEMFFIRSGTVQMVLKEYNNFPFMEIYQGYFFGEVDLLFGETRKHSYIAKTECELLALPKQDFTQVFFEEFRDTGAEIYHNALSRRMITQTIYSEALAQCEIESKKERPEQKLTPQELSKGVLLNEVLKKSVHSYHTQYEQLQEKELGSEEQKKLQKPTSIQIVPEEPVDLGKKGEEEKNEGKVNEAVEEDKKQSEAAVAPKLKGWGKLKALQNKAAPPMEMGAETNSEDEKRDVSTPANSASSLIKKKGPTSKWSLLMNRIEANKTPEMGLFGMQANAAMLGEATPNANKDQLLLLYNRVESLERSVEQIFEIFQSIAPGAANCIES